MGHAHFVGQWSYAALLMPLLALLGLFFYVPMALAVFWSFFLERPFGGSSEYVGLGNFARVLNEPEFWNALRRTIVFMAIEPGISVASSLALALAAERRLVLSSLARNVIVWPAAVAGASIGAVFLFIFNPHIGILSPLNGLFPGLWNPGADGRDAFTAVLVAQTWKSLPFNFLILLAGLRTIPEPLIRAASIDGAGPWRRVRDIQIPLLTPYLFLAFLVESVESAVQIFGLVDTMTEGGPGGATTFLIYKIYRDGFQAFDLSGAATQTTLLLLFVGVILLLLFRIDKYVKYER